ERALLRAAELAPQSMDPLFRAWVISRLQPIENVTFLRRGTRAGGGDVFYARPYLDHDTLAFVPYPVSLVASGHGDPPAAARDSAISHSNAGLLEGAAQWVARDEANAAAWYELATIAEATGGATLGTHRYSAGEIAARAQRLARDTVMQINL